MIDLNDTDHPLSQSKRLVTVDLTDHVETIATRYLGSPNPNHTTKAQWRWGTNGSLALEIEGAQRGAWFDHEQKQGGNDPWSLLTIHLGMTPEQAKQAIEDLGIKDKTKRIVASYDYHDAHGRMLFQVVRYAPKTFRQRRPDGNGGWSWQVKGLQLVPYRLPELLSDTEQRVYLAEGEKDVDSLRKLGVVATCNAGGAGKWLPNYAQWLAGRDVAILADNDEAGRAHALAVSQALHGVARIIRVIELPGLPPKGDVTDWISAGGTLAQLEKLVDESPVWEPSITQTESAPAQQLAPAQPLNGTIHPPITKGAPPDWTKFLALYENGEPRPTLDNCAIAFERDQKWQDVIWLDTFAQRITARRPPPWVKPNGHWNPTPWTDDDLLHACRWVQQAGIPAPPLVVESAVQIVASDKTYHPVKEYLEGLQWDSKPRIDTWLSYYLGADDSPYARAVGARWLISAVARIYRPGAKADHVLILVGEQGLFKSTALRIMADPWFTDQIEDLGSKDSSMQTAGVWVIELAELDSMSRAEMTKVNAFITRTTERYRPPFGRYLVERPRQCVLAGTTNYEDFLRDPTGARRFWPVRCVAVDTDALWRDRGQLWAEAYARFNGGSVWYLDDAGLAGEAETKQSEHRQEDAWTETVMAWVRHNHGHRDITMSDILWHALEIQRQQWTRAEQMRVSAILKTNRWSRRRTSRGGIGVWIYEPPAVQELTESS